MTEKSLKKRIFPDIYFVFQNINFTFVENNDL